MRSPGTPSSATPTRSWQQLWRLAGADHLHVNGLRNKFWEPDDSVLRSARAVLSPINGGPAAMPVFSSAQSADQAADTFDALGSVDLMYVAGGGIMAHPSGVEAGVTSLRQAWAAALDHVPLATFARDHPELAEALELFGKPSVTLGISTYAYQWRSSDRISAPMGLEQIFDDASALGLSLVQVCDWQPLARMSDAELDAVRSMADSRGLTLETGTKGVAPEHLRDPVAHLAAAGVGTPALDAALAVLPAGSGSGGGRTCEPCCRSSRQPE